MFADCARILMRSARDGLYLHLIRRRDNKSALFSSSDIRMRNAYLTGKMQRMWLLMNRLNSSVITAIAFCTVLTPLRDDVEHFRRETQASKRRSYATGYPSSWLSWSQPRRLFEELYRNEATVHRKHVRCLL